MPLVSLSAFFQAGGRQFGLALPRKHTLLLALFYYGSLGPQTKFATFSSGSQGVSYQQCQNTPERGQHQRLISSVRPILAGNPADKVHYQLRWPS